jgi:hypothetical protein
VAAAIGALSALVGFGAVAAGGNNVLDSKRGNGVFVFALP